MARESATLLEGATRALARFAAELRFSDLPPEVVERAKLTFLDWVGAALAGRSSDSARKVCGLLEELGGPEEATVVGDRARRPSLHAALANGVMAAVHEVDDVHLDCRVHPGLPVISAALALAEREGVEGQRLLEAVVAGYEVVVRVTIALGVPHNDYWHSTGTAGSVGAAAAASKILALSPERTARALGLGATQGAGLIDGIEGKALAAKHFHGGKAAQNGIWAALLAGRDFRGSATALEGEWGFLRAFAKGTEAEWRALTEGLGERWAILRNIIKPFACCLGAHAGVHAALALAREHDLTAEAVETVEAFTHPSSFYMIRNPDPRDPLQAKFSLPFCVAAAIARREVSLRVFNAETLRDPAIRGLMARVRLETREEVGRIETRLRVRTRDGRVFERLAERRSMEPEAVREKFRALAADALGPGRAEEIAAWADALEDQASVRSIGPLLRP